MSLPDCTIGPDGASGGRHVNGPGMFCLPVIDSVQRCELGAQVRKYARRITINRLILSSTGTNPIIELARETRTPIHEWNQYTIIIDHNGDCVQSDRANHALSTVWQVLEKAIAHSKASSAEIPATKSLYHYFMLECSSMVNAGAITSKDERLILSMSQMWGAYVGEEIGKQSLKFFYLEDCIGDSELSAFAIDWNLTI